MIRRLVLALSITVAWMLTASAAVDAHRLDEYLQATRVDIGRDRVTVEIDLTPGVALASGVFDTIDTDGDGEITPSEARAYAEAIIAGLAFDVDDRRTAPTLSEVRFPTLEQMANGVGTIRLTATAPLRATWGRHTLRVRNDHRADIGVYLVNTLVPADRDVEIVSQARDTKQHELRLEYRITPAASAITVGAGSALMALLLWRRRTRYGVATLDQSQSWMADR